LPGREVKLKRAVSGSGARYESDGVEFWNKGDDAMIRVDGKETTCRVDPAMSGAKKLKALKKRLLGRGR